MYAPFKVVYDYGAREDNQYIVNTIKKIFLLFVDATSQTNKNGRGYVRFLIMIFVARPVVNVYFVDDVGREWVLGL
jgi:hypothetical protein